MCRANSMDTIPCMDGNDRCRTVSEPLETVYNWRDVECRRHHSPTQSDPQQCEHLQIVSRICQTKDVDAK